MILEKCGRGTYSRAGCGTCKSRKVKCDESRPECSNCSRLGFQCSFDKIIKFSDKRNIVAVSNKHQHDSAEAADQDVQVEGLPGLYSVVQQSMKRPDLPIMNSTVTHEPIFRLSRYLDYNSDLSRRERLYFDIFITRISLHILPFGSSIANPVRDFIVSMCSQYSYLKAAIFAISARTAFRLSGDPADEIACCRYLSSCLSPMVEILSERQTLASKSLAPVVTTVLLLCTAELCSPDSSWRAHLQGARTLLAQQASESDMTFCEVWFAAIEVIASLSSPKGGSLRATAGQQRSFLRDFLQIDSTQLARYGLLKENGFNIFFGYSSDCLHMFDELSYLLDTARCAYGDIDQERVQKLLVGLQNAKQTTFQSSVDNKVISIEVTDMYEPNWFTLSHRAHCEAAILSLYSSLLLLDRNSPLVKESISCLMNLLSHVSYSHPHSSMIHWPLLTLGFYIDDDPYLREFVLERLKLLLKHGVWSAEYSIRRLTTFWTGHSADCDVDVVPF